MKQECQPLLNLMEIRYEYGRWVGSKTWRSVLRVVQPSVLLQDRIGVTRQRQYMEQGEIRIQTSCLELQRYKNYVTKSLTYDDTVHFSTSTYSTQLHQTYSPPLTWKTQKP
jgi:hypothetical protein